jgi:phosphate transport system permease protein
MAAETQQQATRKAFTGRARRHRNRWGVRVADAAARWVITVAGIGTIVAVLLVFVFLLFVAFPLFYPPARLEHELAAPVPWKAEPLAVAVNEYRTLGWALQPDGELLLFRADSGELLRDSSLCDEGTITAVSHDSATGELVLGMADGAVRVARIRFAAEFRESAQVPEEFHGLSEDEPRNFEEGLIERTPQGQFRVQTVAAELSDALALAETAIVAIDHVPGASGESLGGRGPTIAAWTSDGVLHAASTKFNELTGRYKFDERASIPVKSPGKDASAGPLKILLAGRGDTANVVWPDGSLVRIDLRDLSAVKTLETLDLVADDASTLTSCSFTLGRDTIVCGHSTGAVEAWFPVRRVMAAASLARLSGAVEAAPGKAATVDAGTVDAGTVDAGTVDAGTVDAGTVDAGTVDAGTVEAATEVMRLERTHRLPPGRSAVTSLSMSQRSRLMAAGFADGSVAVYHITTEKRVASGASGSQSAVRRAFLSPKDDAFVAFTADQAVRFRFDPKHPEGSLSALFTPVWYEGYDRPSHVWQSSFAGVEPEMKLGLWPLVFGTLKATVYSMTFGVPIALMAALYTSEFMAPRLKAKVKPTIEMMASLPSVVLGFLAALVFAPLVERAVPELLTGFVAVPVCLMAGAAFWQLLPSAWVPYLIPWRFAAIIAVSLLGVAVAAASGEAVERVLFAGDILRWLDGRVGRGTAGWLLLTLPGAAAVVATLSATIVNPWLRQNYGHWPRLRFGLLNAGKLAGAILLAGGLAWGVSELLVLVGWDPRGSFVSTYVQRNALVVGFVMGFAIIPIIYTIADDALSTVPQHLRSASLGAGATQWQTAVRVVVPTAMSGLFSAIMIGLGRAVGETMIVLMAGGNTPVTDWNLFNGFRTLSANIAVELPEAVRDSTHFRTLFLAALTLFLLTFVVNTAAELVRLRFRRRALQL